MTDKKDAFSVCVRIRPLFGRELARAKSHRQPLRVHDNMIWVADPSQHRENCYAFNAIFTEGDSNEDVYSKSVAPLVKSLLSGYNSTCFAYGMTGAGKTHTMVGAACLPTANELGVTFLAIQQCFEDLANKSNDTHVKLSYLEIYNEAVKDLLAPNNSSLMVVEDPIKGGIVPDLTEFEISTLRQVQDLIKQGNVNRAMAQTEGNQFSTRSHAVLQIIIEQKTAIDERVVSKMNLIDLAGSERASVSDNRGQRMREGANINRSLLALGNCINTLSDNRKTGQFVNYRDSKLTRLLKESLGGNTMTVMLACISPAGRAIEETLNTLKYANRASKIKKLVTKNVVNTEAHVSEYKDLVATLKLEIESLKQQLNNQGHTDTPKAAFMSLPDKLWEHDPQANLETEATAEFFEGLANNMKRNFEEQWEVEQSIREIDRLNDENRKKVHLLLKAMTEAKESNDDVRTTNLKNEIVAIQHSIKENQHIRNNLQKGLEENINDRK